MSLGGFGAGFAQTFDGAKFGRALNEGIADYREGKAIEAAEKKKAEAIKEALQKPPLPSRMEQKCSVRLFLTTPECAVFLPMQ